MKSFWGPAAVVVFAIWGISFAWAGFYASDDSLYSAAAVHWLTHFPYVGEDHWSLRQTLILPLALVYKLFGVGEGQLVSVSTLYFAGLVAMTGLWLRRHHSPQAGLIFLFLSGSVPGFVALGGIANVDVAEAFFMTASLMLFWRAREEEGAATRLMALSGLMVGLAFLSRVTSLSLILAYGLCFLLGWYHPRKRYVALGAGAFLVYVTETAYYILLTGDPLYRLHTMLHSHFRADGTPAPDIVTHTGNLMEGSALEPILAVLVNNEFGLTFIAAALIYVWLRRTDIVAEARRAGIGLFFLFALLHFVMAGYLMDLRPLPRYFTILFLPAMMFLAVSLSALWGQGGRRKGMAAGILAALTLSGLMLTDLTNRAPLFAPRILVQAAADHSVYAPADLCHRAGDLLHLKARPAPAGFCVALRLADMAVTQGPVPAPGSVLEGSGLVFDHAEWPEATYTGRTVRLFGLQHILPLPDRLFYAQAPVLVWRRATGKAE